jgi:hypothetical protein
MLYFEMQGLMKINKKRKKNWDLCRVYGHFAVCTRTANEPRGGSVCSWHAGGVHGGIFAVRAGV